MIDLQGVYQSPTKYVLDLASSKIINGFQYVSMPFGLGLSTSAVAYKLTHRKQSNNPIRWQLITGRIQFESTAGTCLHHKE